jgi:hypothetical protein
MYIFASVLGLLSSIVSYSNFGTIFLVQIAEVGHMYAQVPQKEQSRGFGIEGMRSSLLMRICPSVDGL